MSQGYTCHCCGKHYNEIAMSYGTDAPVYVQSMNPSDIKNRVEGNSETCIVDGKHFFVRGNILLPVIGTNEFFGWGVWSTVSEENFDIILETWETEGRENIVKPAFGYLSTALPYPNTINLNMLVHTAPVGERPNFELEPTNHPLAIEQRNGITMARVHEINRLMGG